MVYLLLIFILIASVNLITKFSISKKLRDTHFVLLGFISLAGILLSIATIHNIKHTILGLTIVFVATILSVVYILFRYSEHININDNLYLFIKSNTIYTYLIIICILVPTIILTLILMLHKFI